MGTRRGRGRGRGNAGGEGQYFNCTWTTKVCTSSRSLTPLATVVSRHPFVEPHGKYQENHTSYPHGATCSRPGLKRDLLVDDNIVPGSSRIRCVGASGRAQGGRSRGIAAGGGRSVETRSIAGTNRKLWERCQIKYSKYQKRLTGADQASFPASSSTTIIAWVPAGRLVFQV